MTRREESQLFPALLRHFRARRGMSQLDLALAADVSARHVSFLETGRSSPSQEMVLRLGATLEVPLREQNELLTAAGFPAYFEEPGFAEGLPAPIRQAISRMIAQHEPYPLVVMNRRYDALETSQGASRLLAFMIDDPSALSLPINLFHVLLDPRLGRHAVVDWERVARAMLSRLHREALARPGDARLSALLRELLQYPDLNDSFRQPDLSLPSEATLTLHLRKAGREFTFLTTLTAFSAPQNITLEELCIESYFPSDDATARACEELARAVDAESGPGGNSPLAVP